MDFTKLTKWIVRLLYLQVAISLVAFVSGALEYQLLIDFREGVYSSESASAAVAESNDTRQALVAGLQFIIFATSGVLILRWIYLANRNVRGSGARNMQFTPGWAVAWYFIPIFNLWKPYQAMKEIWQASADPSSWTRGAAPGLLVTWWFCWIVSCLIGNASFRLSWRANELNELLVANFVTQIADVAAIPLAIIFLFVLKRVHLMQASHARPPNEALHADALDPVP